MPSRKRGLVEVEAEPSPPVLQAPSLLKRLRNFWVFACLMQFIYLFGDVFKIDKDFDIEDLEEECLKAGHRLKLADIGLCLLKAISSQRGLTSGDFDEYTSRQYRRRLPDSPNPFGDDEEPNKFLDFDVFTQLRILHQLSLWTLLHPERIREKMDKGDRDVDWRIDVIGWDREDRSYFLLDDSRLYRRTDPSVPVTTKSKLKPKPKPKPKAKAPTKARPARPGIRASKRLKVESEEPLSEIEDDVLSEPPNDDPAESFNENENDLDEGYFWENVAISLGDYEGFLAMIQKSRDPNERNLHRHLTQEVLPQIQKAEENRQKKIAQRERELLNMEKLAHAKRSSRIADKADRDQKEAEARAVVEKHQRDLAAAKAEAARQKQMEEARESRMMTREQRLKEREYKRILHEEELANLSKASEAMESGDAKVSERRLKADMAKKQKELEELQQEEDWVFDCAKCGVHGENIDDGTPIIACERCSVWQHCACLGFTQEEAGNDDFHFVCDTCVRREREAKQREEDAKKPKLPPVKLHVPVTSDAQPTPPRKRGRPRKNPLPEGQTSKPAINGEAAAPKKRKSDMDHVPGMPPMKKFKTPKHKLPNAPIGPATSLPSAIPVPATPNGYQSMHYTFINGPTLSPQGQLNTSQGPNGVPHPPPGLMSPPGPPAALHGAQYASPYGQSLQGSRPTPSHSGVTGNYGYANGHSPTKPAPLSPAIGSSPSLNNVPSPMIEPPKKDMQAAGISPTKHSSPAPPIGLPATSPAQTPSAPPARPMVGFPISKLNTPVVGFLGASPRPGNESAPSPAKPAVQPIAPQILSFPDRQEDQEHPKIAHSQRPDYSKSVGPTASSAPAASQTPLQQAPQVVSEHVQHGPPESLQSLPHASQATKIDDR